VTEDNEYIKVNFVSWIQTSVKVYYFSNASVIPCV